MILKQPDNHPERYLQRALHVTTGLLRWIVPDSAAVAHATPLLEQDVHGELPEELRDPFAVFNRDRKRRAPAIVSTSDGNLLTDKNVNAK